MNPSEIRIEYRPLGALMRAPRNPKAHDVKTLQESLGRFGYVAPVVIDEATGRLVAGHGRLEALEAAKAAGRKRPDRINVSVDGDWLVPVVCGVSFADPREAEAYLLADNQLSMSAGWGDGLAEMVRELKDADALAGLGFSEADLAKLLGQAVAEVEAPIDEAAALRAKWETEPGQLWQIGRHRILCGDATAQSDVERLLGGAEPHIMVTDPPYGVEYDPHWRDDILNDFGPARGDGATNDDISDWSGAWRLSPSAVAYVWHGGLHLVSSQSLVAAGYELRSQIIWVKHHFPISRGHYHWRHEGCWYAVRGGASAAWIGDREQTTVWEVASLNPAGRQEERHAHGTQKPVECMARPIRNHAGDVYEPFAGSGTTLVAAEQLGRRCYAMEIEPKYVAVTLERLATMGLTPQRVA